MAGSTRETFKNTSVTVLRPIKQLLLADFTKPSPHIIPGDMSGPLDNDGYGITQQWAKKMKALGFDGIYGRSRFGAGFCFYIFGTAGEHTDLLAIAGSNSAWNVYQEMQRVILPEDMDSNLLEATNAVPPKDNG